MPFHIQQDNPTVLPRISDVSCLFCAFRLPSIINDEGCFAREFKVKFYRDIISMEEVCYERKKFIFKHKKSDSQTCAL